MDKYQNDLDIIKNAIGDTNSYPVLVALVELQMLLDKLKEKEECNELIEFVNRLLEYEKPITKEDIFDELCFFVNREKVEKIFQESEKE